MVAGVGVFGVTAPMMLMGTICLVCKKRPALWAVWSGVLWVEGLLLAFTATSPWVFAYMIARPELAARTSPLTFIFSALVILTDGAMIAWTLISFRESVLRRSRKNAVLVCALWAAYALAGAAGALLPDLLADTVGALYFTRAMRALAGLSVLRLPMLTASVTVTAAVLRRRGG